MGFKAKAIVKCPIVQVLKQISFQHKAERAGHSKPAQTEQRRAWQSSTKAEKTKAEQSRAEQGSARQSRESKSAWSMAEQSRTEGAEQDRAGQGKAEQGIARQSKDSPQRIAYGIRLLTL